MLRTLLASLFVLASSSALASSPEQCSGFDSTTLHRGQLYIDLDALDEAADLLGLADAAVVNDALLSEAAKAQRTVVRADVAAEVLEQVFAVPLRPKGSRIPSPTELARHGVDAARDELRDLADERQVQLIQAGRMAADAKNRVAQERANLDELRDQVDQGAGPLPYRSELARMIREASFRLGRATSSFQRLTELQAELQDAIELADAATDPLDALACTLAP